MIIQDQEFIAAAHEAGYTFTSDWPELQQLGEWVFEEFPAVALSIREGMEFAIIEHVGVFHIDMYVSSGITGIIFYWKYENRKGITKRKALNPSQRNTLIGICYALKHYSS